MNTKTQRILSVLLVLCMGLALMATAAFAADTESETTRKFVDVASDAYYADAVLWAVDRKITVGTTATTFSPDLACTRAQIVTFLWRYSDSPKAASKSNPFTDVASTAYYYDAVLWAVEKGITVGTSAVTFSPDTPCTRAQIVTFLWRFDGEKEVKAGNPFADVAASDYCYNAVLWAVDEGVTVGTSATTFAPDMNCTRAHAVSFLYGNRQKSAAETPPQAASSDSGDALHEAPYRAEYVHNAEGDFLVFTPQLPWDPNPPEVVDITGQLENGHFAANIPGLLAAQSRFVELQVHDDGSYDLYWDHDPFNDTPWWLETDAEAQP